jgi:2-polyprenyl-6-methoxyphenol hydroxylase-like FAD-dependent oxidoreductase
VLKRQLVLRAELERSGQIEGDHLFFTLLGDALHNMTPYRGIGANTALRDAESLRDALRDVSRRQLLTTRSCPKSSIADAK